ncbi:MAG: hypothetical protein P8N56_05675 [Schleiferiaceae bacterium]|nr:hypothetical protein [Schleiferiaceae bacterium]
MSAQSEPRYYTDSDVRQRLVNFNVYAQPSTIFRRIGTDLNGVRPEVNDRFLSRLNVESGFSADVHLRPLYLGIGVGQTWINYAHALSDDVVQETKARYWSIPFRAGLVTQLSDEVSLEVWPTITYRRAIRFQQSGVNGLVDAPHAPSFWTAGIQVGGNMAITEYLSYSLMGMMDYGFGDLEEGTINRAYAELPLFVGVRMGLRLSL